MIFPWCPTDFPEIDRLAWDAETLYQWAIDHGHTAPIESGKLRDWAAHSVSHNLSANEVAISLPFIAEVAWKIDQDSDSKEELPTLPELTVLAAEYLAIAAKALNAHAPSKMQTSLALATSTINLARQAMDCLLRKRGQSKGGRLRQTQGKDVVLKEADDMLSRGMSKNNVARRLHEKHKIPFGTVRGWLKDR